ncbi:hypothetical protein REPUB_Repub13aG0044300 [Reevesia pubescens]
MKGNDMENGYLICNASRKGLGDITNLQQQPASLRNKDLIDKLQQENMMLMKVLADRNKVIELSGIELQKLRINLEKFQQQNKQLTQTNSQMLALKALKHELGCKNAVVKALKSEVGTNKCAKAGESLKEDGEDKPCDMHRCRKAGESLKEEDVENKLCNTNRRRQSKSLCPSNTKSVQAKDGVDNKRVCLRRQSARFKAQEPETNEDVFEVDDTKFLASSCDDKVHESGTSNVKPVEAKEGVDNKRQSARFKVQEPETTEHVLEVDDTRYIVSSSCYDKVHNSGPISSGSSVKREHEEGSMASGNEAQELRRVSAGRPLRQAAEKVQSYKEMKLNMKMRRED